MRKIKLSLLAAIAAATMVTTGAQASDNTALTKAVVKLIKEQKGLSDEFANVQNQINKFQAEINKANTAYNNAANENKALSLTSSPPSVQTPYKIHTTPGHHRPGIHQRVCIRCIWFRLVAVHSIFACKSGSGSCLVASSFYLMSRLDQYPSIPSMIILIPNDAIKVAAEAAVTR